ncbi:MAG: hypothetical protein ABSC18_04920 [Verrucomicrobiota bacterium]|jgi:hypothetical protein
MKKPGILIRGKSWLCGSLPLALAALALVATGCPSNQYIVQLKPQGNRIERTLVFYRQDGVDANTGAPNYKPFDTNELSAIAALYPAAGLTRQGERYVARGVFTNQMPADVGGAGAYANLTNSLGEAGFYAERFRGKDDLAGITEKRVQAAEQLADMILGWSRMELGGEPGYDKLRQFLDVDFRRDLKNLGAYWWEGRLTGAYSTNAGEEFAVRFGQYLCERGYFTLEEIPGLFSDVSGNDPQAIFGRIQRLVARKMGVPDAQPVPAPLAFLADEAKTEESFGKYLAGTKLYRAQLKQWEEDKILKPDLAQPDPMDLAKDALNTMIESGTFEQEDHLAVQLSLPSAPAHSNGRWDEALQQVIWDTGIEERDKAVQLPFTCYASWTRADEKFQKEHIGKVALTGDDLATYCLWRSSLDARRGGEWEAFLAGLQPGGGLVERIEAFRFSGEPAPAGTNVQQNIPSPSAWPRQLLKTALQ